VLQSFADKETRKIWNEERSRRFPPDIQQRALIKLAMIRQAIDINDLRIPARGA
jgi:proteic killer suppression protein